MGFPTAAAYCAAKFGVSGLTKSVNPVPLFGVSMICKIVLGLDVLTAVLTVGALVYSVVAWKNSYWGIAARVHYMLVTVAAVAFVWFLNYWNLLGWRFYSVSRHE